MPGISAHDLVVIPKPRGNPSFVKGSNFHPQKVRVRSFRRFMDRIFQLQFGKSLDDIVAEAIEARYAEVIGELRIRSEWGDEEALVMLKQRVLELQTVREVRILLKAPGAAEALEADRKKRARPENTAPMQRHAG